MELTNYEYVSHDSDLPEESSDYRELEFNWMARLSRMNGMACVVVDSALNIVFYESSVLDMLEIPTDEDFRGCAFLDIVNHLAERGDFGPGDKSIFCDLISAEMQRPTRRAAEISGLTILTPAGRRLQFRYDGNIEGYHLIRCQDITDSYNKRQALRIALDSTTSGYIIYELETGKYKFHDGVSRVFGTELTDRILNAGMRSVLHPEDIEKSSAAFVAGIKSRKPWSQTFRVLDASGRVLWIRSQATPLLSEAGLVSSIIFFYTEVTKNLRIQDDLRKATERAEKALSAKNDFLGRLSHEIRTPMNAVVGIADALIHHNGDPKILSKLELIQSSAEKIVQMVDESLQHAKLEESKLELNPVGASPRKAVESTVSLWEEKASKNGIRLRCKIDSNVPQSIIFDSFRYEQCLNNLLSNAIKFSPGGTIDVFLTTIGADSKKRLVLAVKDTGIGMNEAQLHSLFEAYTQADKSISARFGGTGLGMNITKQIIELMGGNITARSTIGKGTMIALTLPIQEDRRIEDRRETSRNLVSSMIAAARPAKSDYEDLRILVVDDNSTNHMVIKSLLESLVGTIDVAENGREAIECLERETFDIVLMDIHMPIMDGIEATLFIRGSQKSYANIPIIALTADPQYQQKRLCKNIGMDDALAKPVKLTELLGAFDRLSHKLSDRELAA